MTGYTVHSGTTIKFSESWDRIFNARALKPAKTEQSPKKKTVSGTVKAKARKKLAVKKKR